MNIALVSTLTVLALACTGPARSAGSVDEGRTFFQSSSSPGFGLCVSCHVDPPSASRFNGARFDPDFLTAAFQRIPAMRGNIARLGPQGINDVATYLGLVGQGKPDVSDTDRLLDWGEDTFPDLLKPTRQVTGQALGYVYRFYPATGVYVGTKDGSVWFLDSTRADGQPSNLGTMCSFLDQMPNGR